MVICQFSSVFARYSRSTLASKAVGLTVSRSPSVCFCRDRSKTRRPRQSPPHKMRRNEVRSRQSSRAGGSRTRKHLFLRQAALQMAYRTFSERQWELNPRFRHGKAAGYRYIMGAKLESDCQRSMTPALRNRRHRNRARALGGTRTHVAALRKRYPGRWTTSAVECDRDMPGPVPRGQDMPGPVPLGGMDTPGRLRFVD